MLIIDTFTDINFIIPMVLTILIMISMSILTLLWGIYLINELHKNNNEIIKYNSDFMEWGGITQYWIVKEK